MLVAAALVPDTALLVPGAAGRSDVTAELRADALDAVRAALGDGSAGVVVVAPADERRAAHGPVELVGTVTASLAAAGVPDALLPVVPVVDLAGPPRGSRSAAVPLVTRPPSVASAVALHLLDAVGRRSGMRVVEVPRPRAARSSDEPDVWTTLGRDLVTGDAPVVLVVVGSASGRHGPGAPLAEDPDALEVDTLLVGALADGRAAHLVGALTEQRAAGLAISGWRPWLVLAGAASAGVTDSAHDVTAVHRGEPGTTAAPAAVTDVAARVLFGAQHVVGTWRVPA